MPDFVGVGNSVAWDAIVIDPLEVEKRLKALKPD